jgi:hypothetical protein
VTVDGDVGDVTIGTRSLSAAAQNGAEARIVRDRVDIDYAEWDAEYQSGDTDIEQAQSCVHRGPRNRVPPPRASTACRTRDRSKCEGGGLGKG